jgi:hypothetical protein
MPLLDDGSEGLDDRRGARIGQFLDDGRERFGICDQEVRQFSDSAPPHVPPPCGPPLRTYTGAWRQW